MTHDTTAIPTLVEAQRPVDDACPPLERIALALGSAVIGAGIGFVVTVTTGLVDPQTAAVYGAPVYLITLYLGYGGYRDATDVGGWRVIAPTLLFSAVALWPAAVLLSPEVGPPVWPVTVALLLALCVMTEFPCTHNVYRSSWLILFVAILATNQAIQDLLGP